MRTQGEVCQVVTNKTPNAQQVINDFRNGGCTWIIAVGMISEGTDIPRLQVCCHLSRIRTELHYRQVLGRILRRSSNADEKAWLYVLAEPALQQYSERLADDLPEDHAVLSVVRASQFECDDQTNDDPEDPIGIEIAIFRWLNGRVLFPEWVAITQFRFTARLNPHCMNSIFLSTTELSF